MPIFNINDLCVVIVIYNESIKDSITFTSLSKSIMEYPTPLKIVIYDNSENKQDIEISDYPYWDITYIHDKTNPGVSKSYNIASNLAFDLKKKWLLLTDQDTFFPVNAIDEYLKAINNYKSYNLFVPILMSGNIPFSPSKYYFSRGSVWKNPKQGVCSFKNKTLLNSGIFVSVEAFQSIGGYNEKVKLYFSDFDFVSRFKLKYPEFVIIDLVCFHQLSDVVNIDPASALRRFKYYCEGSYFSSRSKKEYTMLFLTVGLRAIKLSFRYNDIGFFKIFKKIYI
ncbi:glycosyltransferase [Flavobacterium sp.]|uniref:glycosyltransferase n=1 Tax=Flavobacterium sp. TaxID=239 RepID=UPI00374DD6BF